MSAALVAAAAAAAGPPAAAAGRVQPQQLQQQHVPYGLGLRSDHQSSSLPSLGLLLTRQGQHESEGGDKVLGGEGPQLQAVPPGRRLAHQAFPKPQGQQQRQHHDPYHHNHHQQQQQQGQGQGHFRRISTQMQPQQQGQGQGRRMNTQIQPPPQQHWLPQQYSQQQHHQQQGQQQFLPSAQGAGYGSMEGKAAADLAQDEGGVLISVNSLENYVYKEATGNARAHDTAAQAAAGRVMGRGAAAAATAAAAAAARAAVEAATKQGLEQWQRQQQQAFRELMAGTAAGNAGMQYLLVTTSAPVAAGAGAGTAAGAGARAGIAAGAEARTAAGAAAGAGAGTAAGAGAGGVRAAAPMVLGVPIKQEPGEYDCTAAPIAAVGALKSEAAYHQYLQAANATIRQGASGGSGVPVDLGPGCIAAAAADDFKQYGSAVPPRDREEQLQQLYSLLAAGLTEDYCSTAGLGVPLLAAGGQNGVAGAAAQLGVAVLPHQQQQQHGGAVLPQQQHGVAVLPQQQQQHGGAILSQQQQQQWQAPNSLYVLQSFPLAAAVAASVSYGAPGGSSFEGLAGRCQGQAANLAVPSPNILLQPQQGLGRGERQGQGWGQEHGEGWGQGRGPGQGQGQSARVSSGSLEPLARAVPATAMAATAGTHRQGSFHANNMGGSNSGDFGGTMPMLAAAAGGGGGGVPPAGISEYLGGIEGDSLLQAAAAVLQQVPGDSSSNLLTNHQRSQLQLLSQFLGRQGGGPVPVLTNRLPQQLQQHLAAVEKEESMHQQLELRLQLEQQQLSQELGQDLQGWLQGQGGGAVSASAAAVQGGMAAVAGGRGGRLFLGSDEQQYEQAGVLVPKEEM